MPPLGASDTQRGLAALRVVIVDDEPVARRHVRSILAADPEIMVMGECGNGRDAIALIRATTPDLVLLDVQMPELDGFGVLAALAEATSERMPEVIFVTAYDEYAVRAFDVHALDYVLKPIVRARLTQAVARAKARARSGPGDSGDAERRLHELLTMLGNATPRREGRIAVRVDGRLVFIATGSIDWIEAMDDYVRIHAGRTSSLVRGTLTAFEKELGPPFLRVHRSAIVNTERVREVEPLPTGDYRITLLDGVRLPSGRRYRSSVADFLRASAVEHR